MSKSHTGELEKITLSLPRNLVDYADRAAHARGVSRSKLVADILAEAAAIEQDNLAAEGYRFYAEESREFAQSSQKAISEALERDS